MTSIVGGTTGITFPDSTVQTTAATTPTAVANLSGGAAGKIPFQTGASTTSFTAAGTSGQVLTSAGTGTPTWSTPSAGAMVLISTQNITSSVSSVTFNNITSTYTNYLLTIENFWSPTNSGSTATPLMQYICSGTIDTNGVYGSNTTSYRGTSFTNGGASTYSYFFMATGNSIGLSANNAVNIWTNISTYPNTSAGGYIISSYTSGVVGLPSQAGYTQSNSCIYVGNSGLNSTVTGIYISATNSNSFIGKFCLYGISS